MWYGQLVMRKKRVVILMGPPGAGKGTQAEILVETYGFFHLESSKVIEAQFNTHDEDDTVDINGETFRYGLFKKQWLEGELVEPAAVSYWMQEEIRHHAAEGTSLVFSGSPRTMPEAEEQIPLHKELYGAEQMHVFYMQVPAKVSIFRNSHRRICKSCRHPIAYTPETEKLTECPKCAGELVTRELDDPEVIKVRLKEYEERTHPIVEFIRSRDIPVHEIDGMGSIEDVAARIETKLPDDL